MLGLNDLRYFRAAATSTSLRQAARASLISQPALTHVIKRLEAEIGHTLFERRRSGVALTAAGARLLARVEPIIQQWEALGKDLSDADRTLAGRVSIGCHPAVARYTLGAFLPELLARYPALDVRLVHDLSRVVTDSVNSGAIDLGLVVNPFAYPDLVVRHLLDDEVGLWRRPRANPDVLICDPALVQSQWLLKKIARKKPHPFQRIVESSNLEVVLGLAEAGAGTAILPSRVAATARVKLQAVEAPRYTDRVCLVYRPSFSKTHMGRTLIDTISVLKQA